MRKIKLFLTALAVMIISVAFAQNLTVTGNVTDASTGEPVPFASVHEKGTMKGVNTDVNGHYSISVSRNGILVFSSVGHETVETPVDGKARINCELTAEVQVVAKDARGESVTLGFKVQIKDPAEPVSVYPNPVKDFVNVSTLDPADTHIRIVSQTGRTVYDKTSVVSGYDPATLSKGTAGLTGTSSVSYAAFTNAAAVPFSETVLDVSAGYAMWQPSGVNSNVISVAGADSPMKNTLAVAVGYSF